MMFLLVMTYAFVAVFAWGVVYIDDGTIGARALRTAIFWPLYLAAFIVTSFREVLNETGIWPRSPSR